MRVVNDSMMRMYLTKSGLFCHIKRGFSMSGCINWTEVLVHFSKTHAFMFLLQNCMDFSTVCKDFINARGGLFCICSPCHLKPAS